MSALIHVRQMFALGPYTVEPLDLQSVAHLIDADRNLVATGEPTKMAALADLLNVLPNLAEQGAA